MTSDPRKFVRAWLTRYGISIDERGMLSNSDNRDNAEIFDTLYLDYCEQVSAFNQTQEKKIKGAPETNLKKAIEEFISLEIARKRKERFAKIKYTGSVTPLYIQQFVKAVTGEVSPTVEAVLKHFIWSIKRRLSNKEVVYHLMPVVLGKQNGGKSEAVKKLLSPISSLTQNLPLSAVVDPRVQMSFSKTFAVIIDEMTGAQKTDVDALKNLITASELDIRKLHTNQVLKMKQNVSLIGTTNRPVAELIYDTTGSRRFYEIRSLDVLDWAAINNIDYIALWQSIDENKERGYYEEQKEAIVKDQENLTGLEELQVFLDLYKVKPGNKEIAGPILYDAYKLWCESNGVKTPFNSVWFGRRLSGKGFTKPHQKSIRGKNTPFYLIGEEATELHGKSGFDPLLAKEFQ